MTAHPVAAQSVGVMVTAGRVDGGLVNLGVAPLLLVGMLVLLWTGPGALSLDAVIVRSKKSCCSQESHGRD
jgi:uncharacterized membrane protein YphA (DoxX/SURF4 family)